MGEIVYTITIIVKGMLESIFFPKNNATCEGVSNCQGQALSNL